jgi:hypothetical protein
MTEVSEQDTERAIISPMKREEKDSIKVSEKSYESAPSEVSVKPSYRGTTKNDQQKKSS